MTPQTQTATNKTAPTPEPVSAELVPADDAGSMTLAKMADGDLLAAVKADDEWADVDDGDLDPESRGRIPHVVLNRKLDGGFGDPETGEQTTTLDFIWLARSRSRAYWPEGFGKGSRTPACRSNDGIIPDPQLRDAVMSDSCATCAFSQWDAEGNPPPCSSSIEGLIFLPNQFGQGRLARIRWGGIASKPANDYWQSFATMVPKRPPMAYVTHAELEAFDTPNGKFLRPRFSIVSQIDRSQAQGLIEERDRRLSDWKADVADDVAAGHTAAVDDDVAGGGQPAKQYEATTVDGEGAPF